MRLIPRDEQFFGLFDELAQRLAGSARLLQQLFADPAHIDRARGGRSRCWSTRPTTSPTT